MAGRRVCISRIVTLVSRLLARGQATHKWMPSSPTDIQMQGRHDLLVHLLLVRHCSKIGRWTCAPHGHRSWDFVADGWRMNFFLCCCCWPGARPEFTIFFLVPYPLLSASLLSQQWKRNITTSSARIASSWKRAFVNLGSIRPPLRPPSSHNFIFLPSCSGPASVSFPPF